MTVSVLVVDDSPMARKMLIRALPPQWDIKVTQAGSGVEALAEYRSGHVDVMFLDLTMPRADLGRLKNDARWATGYRSVADAQRAPNSRLLTATYSATR